ncbi:glucose dehydrogenase [FAD, quinone]-like [Lutzomyia longipalpis]|uniref:glucose dehydrogenase [FAD, quinone]-like n=1 Tax=Lutzomyia longipalpis TaxID=7200 RepID=UPI002483D2F0|nr:glucose dehydrogenase [FAD, quinone]-like [Lutzomyia longipalpis]
MIRSRAKVLGGIFLGIFFGIIPYIRASSSLFDPSSMDLFRELIVNVSINEGSVPNINLETMFGLEFPRRKLQEAYDFIIVGGGPAGCVLANRLTADGRFSVALLEAGRPEIPFTSDIPMGAPNLQSTPFNWGYTTEPQANACWGVQGRRCRFPHGKALGGSSMMNYMIYTRGNRRDFDAWAAAGNDGWSFADLLPLFIRSENATLKDYPNSPFHGNDGEFPVEDNPFRTPIAAAFVAAAQKVGFKRIDYNSGDQIGVSYLQQNTRLGRRISASRAFLEPIKRRKNLHIFTSTPAVKLDLDRKDHVRGVYAIVGGQLRKIRAKKEVILSAGSFESPKLLILSGIGPQDELKRLQIPLVKDLPVGKLLYEHLSVFGPIFTMDPTHDGLINFDRIVSARVIVDYFHGKGPLTVNGIESLLYVNTNASTEGDPNIPDIEMMQAFTTVAFDSSLATRLGLGLTQTLYKDVYAPLENQRAFQFLPMLLHPKSRGFMRIRSRNPFEHPEFHPNFLTHPQDVEAFLRAIKLGMRITEEEEFRKLGVSLYMPTIRGCEGMVKGSDDYWRCFIKYLSFPLHHQVGTCRMGQDTASVVDSNLRVHGFKNLRVADTSIIPETPSGHTNAYSLVIGEKASDLIMAAWPAIDIRRLRSLRTLRRHRRAKFDWQKSEEVPESSSSTELNPFLDLFRDVGTEANAKADTEPTTTEVSDLKFILRPDGEDLKDPKNQLKDTEDKSTKSPVEMIVESQPSASEDVLKKISLPEGVKYGKGKGHPRVISEALDQATPTEFDDTDVQIDNETKVEHLSPKRPKRRTKRAYETPNQEDLNEFRKILSMTWKATNDGFYNISEFFRKFVDPGKDREW